MNSHDELIGYVKKIWNDKTRFDAPSLFYKYIEALNLEAFLKSSEKFGTPQYLLDANSLEERARFFLKTFRKYIPNAEVFYASKCNDLPFILKTLKEQGLNADVAGLFELKLALKLKFDKIMFTSPGKIDEEFSLVAKKNNKVILNIDNLDEIYRLKDYLKENKINKKIRLSIRVNPDSSITKTWSKYGIELQDLKKTIKLIEEEKNLRLVGLHFHSSWNRTPERYLKKIRIMGEYLAQNLKKETKRLKFLDIGGGFFPEDVATLSKITEKGTLYNLVKDYAEKINENHKLKFDTHGFSVDKVQPLSKFAEEISKQLEKYIYPLNPNIKIYLEPGRFLVTHSTSILLKVIAIKNNSVIVDGGINLVGDYRFEEYSYAPIVNLSQPSLNLKKKIIYGPLCDPSDLWGYSYFGEGIKIGDTLAVLHQGAYTYACAWKFIKPTAQYIAIKDGKLIQVKKTEKFEERYSGCLI